MTTLFDAATLQDMLRRLSGVQAGSRAQWGKMNAAQMCAHGAAAMEVATGERVVKQAFIGKLLAGFFKAKWLGPEPFARNGPTGPDLKITDPRNFAHEQARFAGLLERFGKAGPAGAAKGPHGFFGPLTPEEWGRLMWKHADHHLRQFGA